MLAKILTSQAGRQDVCAHLAHGGDTLPAPHFTASPWAGLYHPRPQERTVQAQPPSVFGSSEATKAFGDKGSLSGPNVS